MKNKKTNKIVTLLLTFILIFTLSGCEAYTDYVDIFGIGDNVLPEELKNVDMDNLTKEELLDIIDNLDLKSDISKIESALGMPFKDFLKQITEVELSSTDLSTDARKQLDELALKMKEYDFNFTNISSLTSEKIYNMTIDELSTTLTGFSVRDIFKSWGPAGDVICDTLEGLYKDIKEDTKEAIDDGINSVNKAIGNKIDKDYTEVTEQDIIDYIQSELEKNGYSEDGGKKVIKETLEAISNEMTPEQKKIMDMFLSASESVTDSNNIDINEQRNIVNNILDDIEKELTPEQVQVLKMFRNVGEVLATFDYINGNSDDFISSIFDAIGVELRQEHRDLLNTFKKML